MNGKSLCAVVAAALMVGVLTEYAPIPPIDLTASGSRCYTAFVFGNDTRRVKGDIRQECGRVHSAPWGNWGVNSDYGTKRDAFQFSGWYRDDGWRQWNSCTAGRSEFRPPNKTYYNDNGYTTQKADPDGANMHATVFWTGPRGVSCRQLYNVPHTYRTLFMSLYELDLFSRDGYVTTLHFSSVTVARPTCSDDWTCEGLSKWRSSRSNDKASARVRVGLFTRRR